MSADGAFNVSDTDLRIVPMDLAKAAPVRRNEWLRPNAGNVTISGSLGDEFIAEIPRVSSVMTVFSGSVS